MSTNLVSSNGLELKSFKLERYFNDGVLYLSGVLEFGEILNAGRFNELVEFSALVSEGIKVEKVLVVDCGIDRMDAGFTGFLNEIKCKDINIRNNGICVEIGKNLEAAVGLEGERSYLRNLFGKFIEVMDAWIEGTERGHRIDFAQKAIYLWSN